jgi:hypothetical protein
MVETLGVTSNLEETFLPLTAEHEGAPSSVEATIARSSTLQTTPASTAKAVESTLEASMHLKTTICKYKMNPTKFLAIGTKSRPKCIALPSQSDTVYSNSMF